MNNLFECKVSYERQTEGGLERVSESYLVDALSFTEAEARIIEEIKPFVGMGELEVTKVLKRKFADIFLSEQDRDDRFYRLKVVFVMYDEKANKDKKVSTAVLIQSDTLLNAINRLNEEYKDVEGGYEIHTATELNILDVFKYELG
ncbi:MAG: phage tail protein [Bacteroidia bacterium]|nr:MAG: phage tail protein [Bacteroidia bacterium]